MSWEEDFRKRYSCPCGKGEYEVISYSDDWGSSKTGYAMLCPECKKKYVYDHTIIGWHSGDEIERGWVLKSVLEEEQKYRKNVETKAKGNYSPPTAKFIINEIIFQSQSSQIKYFV